MWPRRWSIAVARGCSIDAAASRNVSRSVELTTDDILILIADCAEWAERLRTQGAEVVFVTGVELSVMNHGFLEGDSTEERIGWLLSDPARRPERIATVGTRFNAFLREAVAMVRERFHGRVTYAATLSPASAPPPGAARVTSHPAAWRSSKPTKPPALRSG